MDSCSWNNSDSTSAGELGSTNEEDASCSGTVGSTGNKKCVLKILSSS